MDRKCGTPAPPHTPFSTYTYSFCGPVTLGVLRPPHSPRPLLALTRHTRIYVAYVVQRGGWSKGVLVGISFGTNIYNSYDRFHYTQNVATQRVT